jgi:hypothetical protein
MSSAVSSMIRAAPTPKGTASDGSSRVRSHRDGRAAGAEGERDPGKEVMDVASADVDISEHPGAAPDRVRRHACRTEREAEGNEEVEHSRLVRRAAAVAGAQDVHSVARGAFTAEGVPRGRKRHIAAPRICTPSATARASVAAPAVIASRRVRARRRWRFIRSACQSPSRNPGHERERERDRQAAAGDRHAGAAARPRAVRGKRTPHADTSPARSPASISEASHDVAAYPPHARAATSRTASD